MKKYYLFSSVSRCKPCKMLISMLDQQLPNWKNRIEYVDIVSATEEQYELATKLGVMRIPSFTNNEEILSKGGYLDIFKQIGKLCTQE